VPCHAAAALGRVEPDAEVARIVDLARRFAALVHRSSVVLGERDPDAGDALEAWIAEARVCGAAAIETFAPGLEHDGAAVRAALTTPWSDGQAEGRITRLKTIERQSYGRAGFDLLRRRVLLAA
jgi:hypothetical protein